MHNLHEEERLIRPKEFMLLLGIKQSKFYSSLREGKLPQPVMLTPKTKVWPISQVREFIEKIKLGQHSL